MHKDGELLLKTPRVHSINRVLATVVGPTKLPL
jgi:hypothetical protein